MCLLFGCAFVRFLRLHFVAFWICFLLFLLFQLCFLLFPGFSELAWVQRTQTYMLTD